MLEDAAVTKIDLSEGYTSSEITKLFGLNSSQSDPNRNAGFESSGLTEEEYVISSGYHGNENILNRELGSLHADFIDEVITIEEYETFKTLICNGYTYSEAKSAIVAGEKMNFSVELLCEAKIQSIEDKKNGKELDKTYSEVSRKLGIPENAVEFYLKENRSLTKEALLDIGEEAILQQYGREMSSAASARATASTPTVQYSPTHWTIPMIIRIMGLWT